LEQQRKEAEEKAERERREEEARANLQKQQAEAAAAAATQPTAATTAPPGLEESTPQAVETPKFRPGGSLRPGSSAGLRPGSAGLRPGSAVSPADTPSNNGTRPASNRSPLIYSKEMLMQLRDLPYCCCRPDDLPDMTITSSGGGRGGGDRRGSQRGMGDKSWSRGSGENKFRCRCWH
jgi:hypothetical protein